MALPPEYETAIPLPPAAGDSLRPISGLTLYELQLGRLARRVVRTLERNGDVLVPVAELLALAEVQHRQRDGKIEGRIGAPPQRFSLDAAAGQVQVGKRRLAVASKDLVIADGVVYGSLPLLQAAFDLAAIVDRETAAVFVHNPELLPVADRLRREAARAIVIGNAAVARPSHRPASKRAWNGAVLTYQFRTTSDRFAAATAYDVGLATGIGGGSAVARISGAGEAAPVIDGGWTGLWPRGRWLTHLRVGDGLLTGPRPALSRGFAMTNVPFVRPVVVEDMPFAGDLPPDWSIEAYRAGRLVGFDSAGVSGRYELILPVQYGENPIDLVAYGPAGEIRTFNRTFRALPSMLPPGAFEYGVSFGDCRFTRCSAHGNVDLRYGLSRRWTIRGGVSRSAYAALTGAPINALVFELEGEARQFARASARLDPSAAVRIAADYIHYRGHDYLWSTDGRITPSPRAATLQIEFEGRRSHILGTTRTDARAGIAVRAENIMARPYVRFEGLEASGPTIRRWYAGLDATILPRTSFGPFLGGVWMQGKVEAEDARWPSLATVTLARNIASAFRVEGGLRWERGVAGTAVVLSLVSQLAALRSTSLMTAWTADERTRFEQSIGGSAIWSSRTNFALSSEPAIDRGGITGRVFLDVNGDGRAQPDEPSLPETQVTIADRATVTDAGGRYAIWGLSPFEEAIIAVDTIGLASPWWLPTFGSIAVFPAPNGYRTVDLPVAIGGVVEGMLDVDTGTTLPAQPLTVVLIEAATGARIAVEAFSDGVFYRMGVPPGEYRATVDAAIATRLGLVADTIQFALAPAAATDSGAGSAPGDALRYRRGPSVSGLRIGLRPRP